MPGNAVLVTAEGDHTFDYTATDNAGNTATTQQAHIKIDTTPPITTDDAPTSWVDRAVRIHLTATDALSGMGAPAATMYSLDDGATWIVGTTFKIDAHRVTHSTDGLRVLYHSTDAVGNTEAIKVCVVPIDTRPPTTMAWGVLCTQGGAAVFKFEVLDPIPGSPMTSATQPLRIKIRDASGKVVKTLRETAPYPTSHRASLVWAKCLLPKGKYTYAVYAHDQAGNAQIKARSARFRVE
jgi:hypothetical protein